MGNYFKQINTHMHGSLGENVESESFSHDFRLPKCYDMPKLREIGKNKCPLLVSKDKCKQLPENVLFYIFYNIPHDRGQLNAAKELQSRDWIYLTDKMRWLKANKPKETNSTTGT